MAEAKLFFLAYFNDVNHLRGISHLVEQRRFSGPCQYLFQLKIIIEMISNDGLASAGHKHDVAYSRPHGFFHNMLNDGLVIEVISKRF